MLFFRPLFERGIDFFNISDKSYITTRKTMELILNGLLTTFTITIVALIFGMFLAIGLCMCRTLEIPGLNQFAKAYINTFRSLPLVIVLLGFYLVAPEILRTALGIHGDIRMACALVAFSLFEAAYFAEILRSGFNAIPQGQKDACKALGFTTWQSYRIVFIPQAIKNSLPVLFTQAIILFQDTSIVYILGLTDLFGSAKKLGEMSGTIPQWILGATVAYMLISICLQRVANKLGARA
ncbi:ABC transporter permease subunit [Diaphorobacter aerolatus]|uniref:ABC transporter permease subunit n=1 Tax=Diaphorobacter aerolatus TaxID=1288495 RepID=A0A7H0GJ92_9BURK|nr:ABC transporter permease subunit [Diaphorobacter aerolatus]QNP48358.1 ABC transporter permease subunit [Diaphorobacter aerolatus]